MEVIRVIPLSEVGGKLKINGERLLFQKNEDGSVEEVFLLGKAKEVFKRVYKLLDSGIELSVGVEDDEKVLYVAFSDEKERNQVYEQVVKLVPKDCKTELTLIDEYTKKWVTGSLSNFDYLHILNLYASRSIMDLSQYPVFPWVLQDFKSEHLDLSKPEVFRDLSRPIGALNLKRLADFKTRYFELPANDRYLYGTHYSCPGYVVGFLVRHNPDLMIKFQGGKFDNPNRLFNGINKEWQSCLTNPGNVKELIPEFFQTDIRFLIN